MRSALVAALSACVAAALTIPPAGAGVAPIRRAYTATPNDPYFGVEQSASAPQQWAPQKIGAPRVWAEGLATGAGIKVAIVDTGLKLDHPDFDCAGKITDAYDFLDRDTKPDDIDGHGTHVAGTIGACTNNGVGIAGVAPDASLMPLRALSDNNESNRGGFGEIYEAVRYAADHGAHVINMSLSGGPTGSWNAVVGSTEEAVRYAASKGVVLVAAAGNSSATACEAPASFPEVICVGATGPDDDRPWYSNFAAKTQGTTLVAPGGRLLGFCSYKEDILAPWIGSGNCHSGGDGHYHVAAGTSMASPHVAAAAALVYDALGGVRSPETAQRVVDLLRETAVDLGAPGWDANFGHGRVDAYAAVAATGVAPQTPTEKPSPSSSPSGSSSPQPSPTQSESPSPAPGEDPSDGAEPEPSPSPTPTFDDPPTTVATDLSIRFRRSTGSFGGRIRSDDERCLIRVVQLFRKRPGPDALLTRKRSTASGAWRVGDTFGRRGTFYARVGDRRHKPEAGDVLCSAARSRVIRPFA